MKKGRRSKGGLSGGGVCGAPQGCAAKYLHIVFAIAPT